MLRVLPVLAWIAALACAPQPPKPEPGPSAPATAPVGQLPNTAKPVAYRLDLTLIPELETFSGVVEIDVELTQSTDRIFLHGKDFKVRSARIGDLDGVFTEVSATGAAELVFPKPLSGGPATVRIEYTAPFNRALQGIYKVVDADVAYAFSQMEAISARLAFPSFDEPRFKTPFDISVTAKSEHTVIGNTPTIRREPVDGGLVRHVFARTEPLPTYLIAFAVGPLDVVEWQPIPPTELRSRPLPLRGIAARGKGDRLRYALENTADLVTTLEAYFGMAYPYAKLDLIAAPDFAFGAMENVGAIIYREERLLLDETSPIDLRRRFFGTHSHELAHQWFGNYVTPVWWTDIWLNESFASWMGNRATHGARPAEEYQRETLRDAIDVMDDDSLLSARQIREPVLRDNQIWSAFDGITYRKGGGVLEMFEGFLGEGPFREGVRVHMQRFAHSVANADDFAKSLADGSKKPDVVAAFRTFIEQPGIPLVEVASRCEDGRGILALHQSRYRPLGSGIDSAKSWQIPLCYATFRDGNRSDTQCQLFSASKAELAIGECANAVLPNAGGRGYYHFAFDGPGLDALLERFSSLSAAEQLATFASLEASFNAGRIGREALLRGIALAAASEHYDVQIAPFRVASILVGEFGLDEVRDVLEGLYHPVVKTVGLVERPGEPFGHTLMRQDLVEFAARVARDPAVRGELLPIAERHLAKKVNAAERAVAATALKVAAEERGKDFIDAALSALQTERDGAARAELVDALAASPEAELERIYALIPNESLRVNESLKLLGELFKGRGSATLTWVDANFPALLARFPSQFHGRMFEDAELCDEAALGTLSAIEGRARELQGAARYIRQAIERAQLCATLKARMR
ncbi:MAG: M1 family metallopeptidase [Myxococcota bacterium]